MSTDVDIELTVEMVETLIKFFPNYAKDGVVKIHCNNMGLWFVNPENGTYQFLGKAGKSKNTHSTNDPKDDKVTSKKPTLN